MTAGWWGVGGTNSVSSGSVAIGHCDDGYRPNFVLEFRLRSILLEHRTRFDQYQGQMARVKGTR
jgi:hypothetical protein